MTTIATQKPKRRLHLEFKSLEHAFGGSITKGDKRTLAKALVGFANAEGGTLLIGIATDRVEGLDVAKQAEALPSVARLRNRTAAWLPEILSSAHPGLAAHVIPSSGETDFIAIEVPPSDRRPHMSNPHHQYFRRGSSGTIVMQHGGSPRPLFRSPRSEAGTQDVRSGEQDCQLCAAGGGTFAWAAKCAVRRLPETFS